MHLCLLNGSRLYSAVYGIAQICHTQENYSEAYPHYRKASLDEALKTTDVGRTARFMVARYATSLYSAASTDDLDSVSKSDAFTMLLDLAQIDQYHAAYFWVADCYERGIGIAKSTGEALRWFQLAADQCLDMTVESERRIARLQGMPSRGEDLECIPEESEESESDAGTFGILVVYDGS
jgi:TPR repeat protein